MCSNAKTDAKLWHDVLNLVIAQLGTGFFLTSFAFSREFINLLTVPTDTLNFLVISRFVGGFTCLIILAIFRVASEEAKVQRFFFFFFFAFSPGV